MGHGKAVVQDSGARTRKPEASKSSLVIAQEVELWTAHPEGPGSDPRVAQLSMLSLFSFFYGFSVFFTEK